LDRVAPLDTLVRGQRPVRPKRSASLILIDRNGSEPRVLLGRRGADQKFMPNKYVFPGGKTDRSDHRANVTAELREQDRERVFKALGKKASAAGASAVAVSAVRETQEETGLALRADLSLLRLVARAVTPPMFPHRYDTHFFAAFCDEALHRDSAGLTASEELLDLGWHSFSAAKNLALPDITRIILAEAEARLLADPLLENDLPIPFFAMQRGKMVRLTY
jgi:8-oxo-dGTP pyrophosphatase MutT (NUDIX family)